MIIDDHSAMRDKLATLAPAWMAAMVTGGLLGGFGIASVILAFVGGVSLVQGVIENTGYLARLAYIFDPFMKRIGLHGKSVMPLLMGFVCNILRVAGSRIIDSWRQRLVTLVIVPIVPCKALLIVVGFIGAVFFGPRGLPIFVALVAVMLTHIAVTSFLLRRFVVAGEQSGLIMELPPLSLAHLRKCMGLHPDPNEGILPARLLAHRLLHVSHLGGDLLPGRFYRYELPGFIRQGHRTAGGIMGWDWRLCISFMIAFASKEATLGAMAIISGAANATGSNITDMVMDKALWGVVQGEFGAFLAGTGISAASALAFVFAVFFSLPCYGALAMIYAETRSLKWTGGTLLYYFAMSITMWVLAYQAGRLIF